MSIGKRGWGLCFGGIALVAVGFGIGHSSSVRPLVAQQNKTGVPPATASAPATDTPRVVAYIYGTIPITREEYGDYFISLYGKERLDLYVNKRIIEMYCAKKGVDITPDEITAAIDEDCKRMHISRTEFIDKVLANRYKKSLDEWRNDVMKPRLLLAKMCRNSVRVEDEDLKKMFENRYGAKARVKIALWPKEQLSIAQKHYGVLRKSGAEDTPPKYEDFYWDSIAKNQPDSTLASKAGEIEPIGRYSGPQSSKVEEIAFGLKVGEVSPIIGLEIGQLVIKRIGTVEPVKGVTFESVKAELHKEVIERKLESEIPLLFAKIKEEAKPVLLLEQGGATTGMR
jgi:hypothetical protein